MSNWNAVIRNDRKKFVSEVQEFFKDAEKAIDICCHSGLSHLAPQFMQAVIDNAGFDDYTGVLANSYVMAMVVNGKVAPTIGKNRWTISNKRYITYSGHTQYVNTWTSQALQKRGKLFRMATIKEAKKFMPKYKIGRRYKKIYTHGMILSDKRKVRLTRRFNRNNHRKHIYIPQEWYESGFKPKSYGEVLTELKGIRINTGKGSGLVITNAAPYAMKVHNKGSVVIPMAVGKMVEGSVVTIMKNEFNKIKMIKR